MSIVVSNENSILSTEAAKMIETTHYNLMRKLDGRNGRNGHVRGYVEILADNQMDVSRYFIPSTYRDDSGKENKCYIITKLGCEFLANKFTGEKGVLFTARYINRFHQMEEELKQARYNDVEPLPERLATKSLTPLHILYKNRWYYRNLDKLNAIEGATFICKWRFYENLRNRIQDKYNYSEAVATYVNETKAHSFNMKELVDYFPEFQKEANDYIDELFKNPSVQARYEKIVASH